ncbi:KTSC domain-containing protein [uncultured Methanobrevibacter sp.]|uniref:KTSC domain-containing protein n=1 Tax=uncultured Methanobrevibacter sp. TaxID=253161 RepID=UPI0025CD4E84|nr:KTSC domain-containing protein [uncultured Methanobrevibacter sp.]
MIEVRSSNLRAVEYNPSTHTLTIWFRNGSVYEYYGVSQNIYDGLLLAQSKGRYHHRYIKNSYRYCRIR